MVLPKCSGLWLPTAPVGVLGAWRAGNPPVAIVYYGEALSVAAVEPSSVQYGSGGVEVYQASFDGPGICSVNVKLSMYEPSDQIRKRRAEDVIDCFRDVGYLSVSPDETGPGRRVTGNRRS